MNQAEFDKIKAIITTAPPPAGVPQAFWTQYLTNQATKIASSGGTGGLAGDIVVSSLQNPETLKSLGTQAATEYGSLPPDQRAQYGSEKDEDGITSAPGTPGYYEEKIIKLAEDTDEKNRSAWSELANLPLSELASRLGLSSIETQEAHDHFVDAVNAFKPPPIPDALAPIVSEAAKAEADPEAIAAQKRALGKAEGLTSIEETAEERFMREQARRKQERDLFSQRQADKSSLLRRGAFGSGAEIAMTGQAGQEAAERRALEEMSAGANAQKRALLAIGQMGTISGQMRDSSFNEKFKTGSAADTVRNWNREYSEDHNRWKRGQELGDEKDKLSNADAIRAAAAEKTRQDNLGASTLWGAKLNLTEGETGNATSGASAITGALARPATRLYNDALAERMAPEDDGLLGLGLPIGPLKL